MRMKSKKNLEFAHIYCMGMIEECTKREDDKAEIEVKLEQAVRNIIHATTVELMGPENEDEDCDYMPVFFPSKGGYSQHSV